MSRGYQGGFESACGMRPKMDSLPRFLLSFFLPSLSIQVAVQPTCMVARKGGERSSETDVRDKMKGKQPGGIASVSFSSETVSRPGQGEELGNTPPAEEPPPLPLPLPLLHPLQTIRLVGSQDCLQKCW